MWIEIPGLGLNEKLHFEWKMQDLKEFLSWDPYDLLVFLWSLLNSARVGWGSFMHVTTTMMGWPKPEPDLFPHYNLSWPRRHCPSVNPITVHPVTLVITNRVRNHTIKHHLMYQWDEEVLWTQEGKKKGLYILPFRGLLLPLDYLRETGKGEGGGKCNHYWLARWKLHSSLIVTNSTGKPVRTTQGN